MVLYAADDIHVLSFSYKFLWAVTECYGLNVSTPDWRHFKQQQLRPQSENVISSSLVER